MRILRAGSLPTRLVVAIAFGVMPSTRLYPLKARLLRICGYRVDPSARIVSSARFYIPEVAIGRESFLGHQLRVYGGAGDELLLGDSVDIGPHVVFLCGSHRIGSTLRRAGLPKPGRIVVGNGTWIGGGALIVAPCDIGEGCVIAAGAVVRGDLPPNTLYRSQERQEPLRS